MNLPLIKPEPKLESLEHKALSVIDHLCTAVEDGMDKDKALDIIYRIAHSAYPTSCHDVHDDWRKEIQERYKQEGKV